jgi:hypothetical protein
MLNLYLIHVNKSLCHMPTLVGDQIHYKPYYIYGESKYEIVFVDFFFQPNFAKMSCCIQLWSHHLIA